MEPWHLLHSVLTCPSSGSAQHLKSRHPFHTRCSTAYEFIWRQNQKGGMQTSWSALRDSVLCSLTHPPGMALPRTACSSAAEWGRRPWPLRNILAEIFTGALHQFSIVRRQTERTIGHTSGDWPTLNKNPRLRNCGSKSTASAQVLDVSGRFCSLRAGRSRLNRWPYFLPMSNPSTSPWIARPDVPDDETIDWLLNTCPEI